MATSRTYGAAYGVLDAPSGKTGRQYVRRGSLTANTSSGGLGSYVFPARAILGCAATALNGATSATTFVVAVSGISGGTISVTSVVLTYSGPTAALGAASVMVTADYS